jgi:gliding motility-associated-like protein
MRRFILLILLILGFLSGFSQKETYNWYFGNKAGLRYHTGVPVAVDTSAMFSFQTTASISDTAGNLRFYSNSETVWNRNHEVMPNGDSLKGWSGRALAVVAVPAPGKADQYYIFTSYPYGTTNSYNTAYYSIIDMSADNGLGDVIVKNIPVPGGADIQSPLVMTMHANNEAFWLVMMKVGYSGSDTLFSYILDEYGLNSIPVKTVIGHTGNIFMKFAPNGEYMFFGGFNGGNSMILQFNKATGMFQEILEFDPEPGDDDYYYVEGAEFSANSEFLYCTMWKRPFWLNDTTTCKIVQYDLSKIGDVTQFEASAFVLDVTIRIFPQTAAYHYLQMGPDGKIVVGTFRFSLGVINYPERPGFNSGLQFDAISVAPRTSTGGLPNFVQSYFMKFNWKGNCLGDTTMFESWFLPIPDSIHWEFGEPSSGSSNFSNLLNPGHKYSAFGTYTVQVTAYYPDGNTQEYSREVMITPYPSFELGPDKYICHDDQVTINSNAMLVQYHWSTGETTPAIVVDEPGKYWLEVVNNNACKASDTISVIEYSPPLLIDSLLVVSPTTCGNDTGAVRHLQIEGGDLPVNVQWIDQWGNAISVDPDITGLSVGWYFLTATYGAGCYDTLANYSIVNYDSDLIIEDVIVLSDAYCGLPTGSLKINVQEGLTDMLHYSVNGIDFYPNEGHFEGLPPGDYIVMIKDFDDCEAVYNNNPVKIAGYGSLDVVSVDFADDHCCQGMGEITISGPGNDPSIYWYSNDGGTTWLQNNGEFTSLTEGSYNLMIRDASGCTGAYISNPVEIDNLPGPVITSRIITPETGSDANGTITLTATGDDLSYSLNNGPTQDNGHFDGLSAGDYTITITDLFGCITDTLLHVDQITGSYLMAMAGNDRKCLHKIANTNIRVTSITGVKSLKATLSYDGQRLLCTHFNDSLPGITASIYETLSRIVLEWHGTTAITSTDTISLGKLIFQTKETGLADIMWDLDASNTFFTDENGNAITPVLIPGAVTVHDPPVLALSEPLPLCQGGSTRLVPGIAGGTEPVSYQWQTPQGTIINTEVEIANATPDNSGIYTLMVSDYFHCADTVSTVVEVIPLPSANFPASNPTHDTIYYEQTFLLEAAAGFASYEWNTGDTTYFITGTEEGTYSVIIKTAEGCTAIDSAYLKDVYMPFYFNVPNAFTPNGDGLNDTFCPVVDYERVRMFSMVIFSRWGQLIFETNNPTEGWDGKDAPAGVYGWVISYSDYLGKVFKMRGSVTMVR